MNQGIWLFLGVFLTFASAWLGLVFFPNAQLKDLQAQRDEITGRVDPSPYSGEALRGRRVYVTEGCVYCHTQQVRGGDYNADLERGWGARRSHPRDYIHDVP
jgi:cytochrome c oxidase cbb3-type subunit 2